MKGAISGGSVEITADPPGQTVMVSEVGPFEFPNSVIFNTDYNLVVGSYPTDNYCFVQKHGSGTVEDGKNVTDPVVKCVYFDLIGQSSCLDSQGKEPRHCKQEGVDYNTCLQKCAEKYWCNGFMHHPSNKCYMYMNENQGQKCPDGMSFVYRIGVSRVAPQKVRSSPNAWKCLKKFNPDSKFWIEKPASLPDPECPNGFEVCNDEACCREAEGLFKSVEGYAQTPDAEKNTNPKGCYWTGEKFFWNNGDASGAITARQSVCKNKNPSASVEAEIGTDPEAASDNDVVKVNLWILFIPSLLITAVCWLCSRDRGDSWQYEALPEA